VFLASFFSCGVSFVTKLVYFYWAVCFFVILFFVSGLLILLSFFVLGDGGVIIFLELWGCNLGSG
jgi:hypothetical protein